MAQGGDFVAHCCCLFKLQVPRQPEHFLLEFLDLLYRLLGREPYNLASCATLHSRHRARAFHDVLDGLADRGRHNAVLLVVGDLLAAAPVHLGHGTFHGPGNSVSVEDRRAMFVSCRAADGLDQRPLRTQETFLVRIQDGDQRYLWQVQAFAQQIDAHQQAAGHG